MKWIVGDGGVYCIGLFWSVSLECEVWCIHKAWFKNDWVFFKATVSGGLLFNLSFVIIMDFVLG